MEKIKQNPFVKKVGFNRVVLCFVLILLYGFFCAMTQGDFAGISRILSALNYAYFLGFLSLGVTFVIATGGIDFSIGPVMFCCALDFRIQPHYIWSPDAVSYGDQYSGRPSLRYLQRLLGSILVRTVIHYIHGEYEYRKRPRICIYKDTVCKLAAVFRRGRMVQISG